MDITQSGCQHRDNGKGFVSGFLKAAFLPMQVGPTLGQRESLTSGGQRAWVADPPFPSLFSGLRFLICKMGVMITAVTNCQALY